MTVFWGVVFRHSVGAVCGRGKRGGAAASGERVTTAGYRQAGLSQERILTTTLQGS